MRQRHDGRCRDGAMCREQTVRSLNQEQVASHLLQDTTTAFPSRAGSGSGGRVSDCIMGTIAYTSPESRVLGWALG